MTEISTTDRNERASLKYEDNILIDNVTVNGKKMIGNVVVLELIP